jgi:hypothetical protein
VADEEKLMERETETETETERNSIARKCRTEKSFMREEKRDKAGEREREKVKKMTTNREKNCVTNVTVDFRV